MCDYVQLVRHSVRQGPLVGPSSVTSAVQQVTSKAQLHTSKTKVALVRCVCIIVHPSRHISGLKCATRKDKKHGHTVHTAHGP